MTVIENLNPRAQYNGPLSVDDELPITFPYTNPEDVQCILGEMNIQYNIDYTIFEQTLTLKRDVAKDQTITIYRATPLDQQAEFPQNNKFNSAKMNEALDKICMQQQEQEEVIARCMKASITTMNFNGSIPTPKAGRALKINADATGFEMSEFDPDLALVTTEAFKNQAQQAAEEARLAQETAASNELESSRQAGIATEQAGIATEQAGIATEQAENVTNTTRDALESINTAKDDALGNISTAKNNALENINTAEDGALENINTAEDGALENISTAKDNALGNINTAKNNVLEIIEDIKVVTTLKIGQIGIAPLGIDETLNMERYLNGQIIIQDQFKGFTAFIKKRVALYPNIACLENEWQTIVANSDFSQCGKFVIDDNAGTIRLPKVVNIQGLTDLSKSGDLVEAGLPNITGKNHSIRDNASSYTGEGAITSTGMLKNGAFSIGGDSGTAWYTFDASKSNPIYSNSDTVQPESIQYPYFIQVATGAEEEVNITNTFETNIPYTLLDSVYSEYPKYNASMLLSAGQENPKGTYPDVYDALLIEQNSDIATGTTVTLTSGTSYTKRGLSVKNSTDSDITDFDFVVNTANESFVLATKNGSEALIGDTQITINTFTALGSTYIAPANGILCLEVTSTTAPATIQLTNQDSGEIQKRYVNTSGYSIKISIEAKKGQTIELSDLQNTSFVTCYFIPNVGNGPLYFYVGTTTQNDNIVNLGRVEEQLVNKVDVNDLVEAQVVVETYQNGSSWYRVYSDGWCEQGGIWTGNITVKVGYSTGFDITFLKTFKNTEYNVNYTNFGIDGTNSYCMPLRVYNAATDSCNFQFGQYGPEERALNKVSWEAKGYLA